jgi:hypothetical protein
MVPRFWRSTFQSGCRREIDCTEMYPYGQLRSLEAISRQKWPNPSNAKSDLVPYIPKAVFSSLVFYLLHTKPSPWPWHFSPSLSPPRRPIPSVLRTTSANNVHDKRDPSKASKNADVTEEEAANSSSAAEKRQPRTLDRAAGQENVPPRNSKDLICTPR